MAETATLARPAGRALPGLRLRVVQLLTPAAGCVGLAILFLDRPVWPVFAAAAGLFLLAALAIWLRARIAAARHRAVWAAARAIWEHDRAATLATDTDGRILYRNPAARACLPQDARHVSDAVGSLFAVPAGVVQRLRARARVEGAAREPVTSVPGGQTLSVHRVEDAGYLWRLDGPAAPGRSPDGAVPALPMLRVSRSGAVLDINPAMEILLGGRPRTLDRVVTDLPLRSDSPNRLAGADGPVEAWLAEVPEEDGVRQIYVWPGPVPRRNPAAADALPVPLVLMSPQGDILLANSRARALLKMAPDEKAGFAQMVEGLGRPVDEWLLDVTEGRSPGRTEVVRATRPAQDVYLQVSLGRLVEQGEVSIMAVLIDATELKTLEAQFVQSQKMQAIGQLAGGVAHDFNNLLTAISGHCDLLLLRHEPGDPNYNDLVQINQNANRAASLVGQLLAFSRKQNLQPELIDLRETLGDLTHLLNRLVGEKIDLSWTHDPDLPRIRADKRQLEQVLMNLVVNARDAMPDGGRITTSTRAVRLDAALERDRAEVPPGDYVMVRVEDEGCGIPADKLPKIFEPFYSTKRLGEGTGLGLSMAYGIVKQSGGYIFADSVVGQGSVFTMYFPAHRGAPPVADAVVPAAPDLAEPPSGGVVLLVEDEAPVRAFASRALRLRGYTVVEAESAEEALEKLEDEALEVDIFVTDVVMPGMDGPSWVAQALKRRPGVKVIFVSGYSEDSVSHHRATIPNSVFLPKPFSLSQLTETVQRQIH